MSANLLALWFQLEPVSVGVGTPPVPTGLPFTSKTCDEPSVVNSSPLDANTKAPPPSCFPAKVPVETLRR
jgi:hypothetical protein